MEGVDVVSLPFYKLSTKFGDLVRAKHGCAWLLSGMRRSAGALSASGLPMWCIARNDHLPRTDTRRGEAPPDLEGASACSSCGDIWNGFCVKIPSSPPIAVLLFTIQKRAGNRLRAGSLRWIVANRITFIFARLISSACVCLAPQRPEKLIHICPAAGVERNVWEENRQRYGSCVLIMFKH